MKADDSVQRASFLVNESPATFIGSLNRQNRRFLRAIDPDFWLYQAAIHQPALRRKGDKQHAALALRLVYGQALETLFALIGALVQAPRFPMGWVTRYNNGQLRSVVQKIHNEQPIRKGLRIDADWVSISREVHKFAAPRARYDLAAEFAETWRRLAATFLEENFEAEYNSIKHGMRALPGGFSVSFAIPGKPESAQVLGACEFGSTFSRANKIGKLKHTYELHHISRAWLPRQQFIGQLKLIAWSVQNITAYLLIVAGEDLSKINFKWPATRTAFRSPWRHDATIEQLVLPEGINADAVTELTEAEIKSFYDNAARKRKGAE